MTKSFDQLALHPETLLENIQGGIVYSDFDPPFHLRFVTEGMTQLTGYSQEELLSMHQMDIVHPDEHEKLTEDVGAQFAKGDTFEVEYRLSRKDGSLVWVLDRAKAVLHADGKKYIHCLLTDITDLKKLQQELHLSQEKYKLVMQESGNVIIEFDVATEVVTFSENHTEVFGVDPIGPTPFNTLVEQGVVSEEYVQIFAEALKRAGITRASVMVEFKLFDSEGEGFWCSMQLAPISNVSGEVVSLIGCVRNINEQKKRMEALIELSETDPLTGVFNRKAFERRVNEHLDNSDFSCTDALFVLDVDGFKLINDQCGHSFGDQVLEELGRVLGVSLPEHSLIGRLGGDEFLVFAGSTTGREDLQNMATNLIELVSNHFQDWEKSVTVSLGLAFPHEGCSGFYELYKAADVALYQAKAAGRNQAKFFTQ